MTLVSLKIDPEKLERIDAEAKRQGITRTALLLKPWIDEKPEPTPGIRPAHDITCKCWTCKPPK